MVCLRVVGVLISIVVPVVMSLPHSPTHMGVVGVMGVVKA